MILGWYWRNVADMVRVWHNSSTFTHGFLVLPGVLSPAEVATLRAGLERVFAQHSPEADIYHMQDIWRPKMFEHGQEFEALIDHPGIAAEAGAGGLAA